MTGFVGLTVAIILVSNVVMPTIMSAQQSAYNVSGFQSINNIFPMMITIIPLLFVVGLLLMFVRGFGGDTDSDSISSSSEDDDENKHKGKYRKNVSRNRQQEDEQEEEQQDTGDYQ